MCWGGGTACSVERNWRSDAAVLFAMLAMLLKLGGGGGPVKTGAKGWPDATT